LPLAQDTGQEIHRTFLSRDASQIEKHSTNPGEQQPANQSGPFDDGHLGDGDLDDGPFDEAALVEPIVTVDRKNAVRGSFVAACVLGFVLLAGSVTLIGPKAFRDFNSFMLLLLGTSIACLCFIAAIWIRARWICVAVLDEAGLIASTLERKYDLTWGELIGARTYTKVSKDANKVQLRLVLLLEDSRCLETPVDYSQWNQLLRIAFSAQFKPDSSGQRLGAVKGITLVLLGIAAVTLGLWWDGIVVNQFNKGILFQGNARAIVLKLAAAAVLPVGGVCCIVWGLYHTLARPILYKPGYIANHP
jgi:hypothetical protein